MDAKLIRPSPAMVVACIAVVIAAGTASYAANTVGSSDIIDESILSEDIKNNALAGVDILNNSLTTFDIRGADVNGGTISLNAGFVANGRCRNFNVAATGAKVGEAVLFSLQAAIPQGILIYGESVLSANIVNAKVCNLMGTTFPQLTDIPVRVLTFR